MTILICNKHFDTYLYLFSQSRSSFFTPYCDLVSDDIDDDTKSINSIKTVNAFDIKDIIINSIDIINLQLFTVYFLTESYVRLWNHQVVKFVVL